MEVLPEIPNKNHSDNFFDDGELVDKNIIDLLNQNHKNGEKEEPSDLSPNSTLNSTETSKKKKPFKCDVCDKSFTSNKLLKKHTHSVHDKNKPFKCDVCSYYFSNLGTLNRHTATFHTAKECSRCNSIFKSHGEFKLHVYSVHKGKKPYECSNCDFKCDTKGILTRHVKVIHEGKRPFKCDVCSRNFPTKYSLKSHIVHSMLRTIY